MVPELGHYALVLALCTALVLASLPLAGAATGRTNWMAVAGAAAWGQFLFVALAYGTLTYAFVVSDFSVLYVANNSNSALPLIYKISGVWGAHEGSLLLWVLILTGWTAAVALFSRSLSDEMRARVLAVLGLVSIGFLLFTLFTSNPFARHFPPAADGADLNPLLQDPGMAIHPPMLYMGYVGFAVPFAFAIAALIGGRLDSAWARWSRPWTIMAWSFLTMGITLGSWWAYYELGWGGWWFWDPVENASFMPWLVGTALVHSLAMTEKRGMFRSWTVLLAILAFSLSLLGTFLVRSGVLTSVHAFATDPERGVFILAFLAIVIGGSLSLYAWRASQVRVSGHFGWLSRESLLLLNNVFLVVAAATILLGTIYPLILDALGKGKISVGPPYFNTVFLPLMVPLLFLAGIGPVTQWRQHSLIRLGKDLRLVFIATVLITALSVYLLDSPRVVAILVGVGLSVWLISSSVNTLRERMVRRRRTGFSAFSLPRGVYGMTLAHIGLAVTAIGVTVAIAGSDEQDVRMAVGDSKRLGEYTFHLQSVERHQGPNYVARIGVMKVTRDDQEVTVLRPEKRHYAVRGNVMTEAGIDSGLTRDLYVSLGEPLDDDEQVWSVRLYYKPFISWIWWGGALMALGGILAASDRRYLATARKRLSDPQDLLADAAVP